MHLVRLCSQYPVCLPYICCHSNDSMRCQEASATSRGAVSVEREDGKLGIVPFNMATLHNDELTRQIRHRSNSKHYILCFTVCLSAHENLNYSWGCLIIFRKMYYLFLFLKTLYLICNVLRWYFHLIDILIIAKYYYILLFSIHSIE